MKKILEGKRKLVFALCGLFLFLIVSAITNPTKEDYIKFDEELTGISIPDSVYIAQANFFLFSIYAPTRKNTINEYGIIYLGFMGHFFKVADGQFDDSIWRKWLE